MTTATTMRVVLPRLGGRPILETGDRFSQREFHERYLQCPDEVKFELIGGIVYMASPLRRPHSWYDGELGYILEIFRRATPGTEVLHNSTAILGDESEPQPDLGLRILPECGGQSRDSDDGDYVVGAPEFVAEIAYSTRALDMHAKRDDYKKAGVLEYVVVCVEEKELHWFHFPSDDRIAPGRDGVAKSRVFPGLWVHVPALLALDSARVEEAARRGIASKNHTAFARRLQAARRKLP